MEASCAGDGGNWPVARTAALGLPTGRIRTERFSARLISAWKRASPRALLGQVTADRIQIRCVDAVPEPASIGCGAPIRIGAQREETRVPAGSKAQQDNLGSVEVKKMGQLRGAAALIRKLK